MHFVRSIFILTYGHELFLTIYFTLKNINWSWTPVAHACNFSYSGGRDQEDRDMKPAWASSSGDHISKKIHHKKWLKCRSWVQTPVSQRKNINWYEEWSLQQGYRFSTILHFIVIFETIRCSLLTFKRDQKPDVHFKKAYGWSCDGGGRRGWYYLKDGSRSSSSH
jgi:hypothetical protein